MRYLKNFYVLIYNLIFRPQVRSYKVSTRAKIGSGSKISENSEIDSSTQIGKYSYVGQYTTITSSNIGSYTSIASFVKIGHGEHPLDSFSTCSVFYDNTYKKLTEKECIIGNDVWIGTDAIILRGVRIGDGAVIGANSVVTGDVPPYAIVVGSPARLLRYRFEEHVRHMLIKSKWWNKELAEAKTILKELNEICK